MIYSIKIICCAILSTLLFLSCSINKAAKKELKYSLDTNKAILQITNENNNFYISVRDTSNGYKYLNAINGCGNCYIHFSDTTIRKVKLSTQKQNEYAIVADVNGSTYGAAYLFIVWNDGTEWNITRAPFHKFEIKKIGNQDEIINYTTSKKEVYHFENGQFLKKE